MGREKSDPLPQAVTGGWGPWPSNEEVNNVILRKELHWSQLE